MVVIQDLLINGFTEITLLIKLVLLIKLLDMILDLVVQLKLNAEIVSHKRDVGLKKEQKFILLKNMEQ
jgi:ABC-type phosphonate transport system ATPase subunit